MSRYKDDSENYQAILDALSDGNIGYAASNFRSSDSIIVVGKDETNKKFTLTANWPNAHIVGLLHILNTICCIMTLYMMP